MPDGVSDGMSPRVKYPAARRRSRSAGPRAGRRLVAALLATAGFVGGALVVNAADEAVGHDAPGRPAPVLLPATEPLAADRLVAGPLPGT